MFIGQSIHMSQSTENHLIIIINASNVDVLEFKERFQRFSCSLKWGFRHKLSLQTQYG